MLFRLCFLSVMLAATSTQAGNWGQWRGPHFNGSTEETNLPTKWSQTENVAWSVAMPGPSASTPAVWGDHVFVSSTDQKKQTLVAICLDRKSGKILWQHDVAKGISKDNRSTYAGPSPATDGKHVVFFYGNGDLVTYDLQGQKKWSKNVGPFAFGWTFSTSPLLYDGKLYMQILEHDSTVDGMRTNKSCLLALDPETGDELWRKLRPSKAQGESLEAFTTPVPYVHDGRKQVLIAGGDALTGHDPTTGDELWRWGTWNPERIGHWRLVPSPIAGDGVVLACAPKRDPVYAVTADGTGNLGDAGVLWTSKNERPVSSDVPTPAFYDGDFFVLSDVRGMLSRVEPKTGKIKWTVKTPGRAKYEASPLAADGKLYLINFDGEVSIIDTKDGKVINTIAMEDDPKGRIRSSVIAAQGQLFVRTDSKLFCLGK